MAIHLRDISVRTKATDKTDKAILLACLKSHKAMYLRRGALGSCIADVQEVLAI